MSSGEGVSGDPDPRELGAGGCQSERRELESDLTPGGASLHVDAPACRVRLHGAERAQVKQQGSAPGADPADAAATHRQAQAAFAREAGGGDHVGGSRGGDDHVGVPGDLEVGEPRGRGLREGVVFAVNGAAVQVRGEPAVIGGRQ
jgi:hypothetical protein